MQQEQIFIAYSEEDSKYAHMLKEILEAYDFKIWIYEKAVRAGSQIYEEAANAISQVHYFIVIVSDKSVISNWVNREVNLALAEHDERNMPIIPFKIDNTEIPKKWPIRYMHAPMLPELLSLVNIQEQMTSLLHGLGVGEKWGIDIRQETMTSILWPVSEAIPFAETRHRRHNRILCLSKNQQASQEIAHALKQADFAHVEAVVVNEPLTFEPFEGRYAMIIFNSFFHNSQFNDDEIVQYIATVPQPQKFLLLIKGRFFQGTLPDGVTLLYATNENTLVPRLHEGLAESTKTTK